MGKRERENDAKGFSWAKEKKNWTVAQWSKVLFSDESKCCFHLETMVLESGGRVEKLVAKLLEVQC